MELLSHPTKITGDCVRYNTMDNRLYCQDNVMEYKCKSLVPIKIVLFCACCDQHKNGWLIKGISALIKNSWQSTKNFVY